MSILQLVIDEPDIRDALIGVPLYLHTMITYAAVFLLKIQQHWKAARLSTDGALIGENVGKVIEYFNKEGASERHLSYHIAQGLTKMLGRLDLGKRADVNPESGLGNVDHPDTGVGFQGMNAGEAVNASSFPQHGDSPDMFDDSFFPVGFFDLTNAGPWQWQNGSM